MWGENKVRGGEGGKKQSELTGSIEKYSVIHIFFLPKGGNFSPQRAGKHTC